MRPWRRRGGHDTREPDAGVDVDEPVFSDVKLVKRTRRDPRDVIAELSAAFGDDDTDGRTKPDRAHRVDRVDRADRADELDRRADGDEADDPGEQSDDTTAPTRGAKRTTIAIGGGDDLPDARYLDDDLDADDGSDTVFIDDDGTGDAVMPKDATGPGIEPRLRQRRIGVRRAEGRRRLVWAGAIGLVFVVVVGVLAVLGSSWFAVSDVDISGFENADRDAVVGVVDDLLDTPVLLVDTAAAERTLEAIPWVEGARVRTHFPHRVTLELRERTPVATIRGIDGRFRILDEDGRVLDVIEGQPIAYALITGPPVGELDPGDYAGVGHAAAAAIVPKLTPAIRTRLVSMSTTDDGADLRFVLSNDPGPPIEARLGAAIGDNDQLERLVRLQLLLDDVIGSDTTVIDVSTGEATER